MATKKSAEPRRGKIRSDSAGSGAGRGDGIFALEESWLRRGSATSITDGDRTGFRRRRSPVDATWVNANLVHPAWYHRTWLTTPPSRPRLRRALPAASIAEFPPVRANVCAGGNSSPAASCSGAPTAASPIANPATTPCYGFHASAYTAASSAATSSPADCTARRPRLRQSTRTSTAARDRREPSTDRSGDAPPTETDRIRQTGAEG